MPLKAEAYYRTIAERALADAGIHELPVPLERLAESLGIPVRMVVLPGFFGGAIVNEDGLPVLLVNTAHTEQRRRHTLAHLLAHVLIVVDGGFYPRNTAKEHFDAEALATELLMPQAAVVEQSRLWFNDYRYLARMFAVDEGAMLERMRMLSIIKGPRGIGWEY